MTDGRAAPGPALVGRGAHDGVRFHVLGVDLEVTAEDPAVVEHLTGLLRHLDPHSDGGGPVCSFHVAGTGDDLAVASSEGTPVGAPGQPALRTLLRAVDEAVIARSPRVLVHAACAVHDGGAVALAGRSGSGKSTLVAGLVDAGLGYLTDELTSPDETGAISPYPRPLSLEEGSWPSLPHLEPEVPPALARALAGAWQVDPVAIRPGAVAEAVPLRHLVLVQHQPGATTELEPLTRPEALLALVECTFHLHARPAVVLDAVATAIRGTATCHRLTYGDLDSGVAAVLGVLEAGDGARPVAPGARSPTEAPLLPHPMEALCAELVAAMAEAGVGCAVLKGPAIARWLYADGTPRPYHDVDVLVDPRALHDAYDVLFALGFVPPAPAYVDDVPGHAQAWHRYGDGAWCDLHYTLTGVGVSPPELWDALSVRREPLALDGPTGPGVEVPALDDAARALHLALHLAQDHLGQPKKRTDLTRALAQLDPAVWEQAATLAGELGAAPAMGAGLRQDPEGARLADRLELPQPDTVDLLVRSGGGAPGTDAFEWLMRRPGLTGKARYALAKALPPPWFLRAWTPIANRWGPLGLLLGYLQRVRWLATRTPAAARSWWQARRALRAGGDGS